MPRLLISSVKASLLSIVPSSSEDESNRAGEGPGHLSVVSVLGRSLYFFYTVPLNTSVLGRVLAIVMFHVIS